MNRRNFTLAALAAATLPASAYARGGRYTGECDNCSMQSWSDYSNQGGKTRKNGRYTHQGPYDANYSSQNGKRPGTNSPGRGDPGGAPNKGDCNCGR